MEYKLSVSELGVKDAGSLVCMNSSDGMWMSGVSMDIREAMSKTTDIESEVPDEETSEVLRQCIPKIIVTGLCCGVPGVLGA